MAKARRLHRSHAVGALEIGPGVATTSVSDSDGEIFDVEVTVVAPPLGNPVPAANDIVTTCTCDDDGDVCRHALAAVLSVAEEVEANVRTLDLWTGADAPPPSTTTYESPGADAQSFFAGNWPGFPEPLVVSQLRPDRSASLVVDGIDAEPVVNDALRAIADELAKRR